MEKQQVIKDMHRHLVETYSLRRMSDADIKHAESLLAKYPIKTPDAANTLGRGEIVPPASLGQILLNESSSEIRLSDDVNDSVWSDKGVGYVSVRHDPRLGFFERADLIRGVNQPDGEGNPETTFVAEDSGEESDPQPADTPETPAE